MRTPKAGAVYVWHCECGVHYVGFTTDIAGRSADHMNGDHPLIKKHLEMGHAWRLSRVWPDASDLLEWRIKHVWKRTKLLCPLCNPGALNLLANARELEGVWLREADPWRMKNRGPSSRVHNIYLRRVEDK